MIISCYCIIFHHRTENANEKKKIRWKIELTEKQFEIQMKVICVRFNWILFAFFVSTKWICFYNFYLVGSSIFLPFLPFVRFSSASNRQCEAIRKLLYTIFACKYPVDNNLRSISVFVFRFFFFPWMFKQFSKFIKLLNNCSDIVILEIRSKSLLCWLCVACAYSSLFESASLSSYK